MSLELLTTKVLALSPDSPVDDVLAALDTLAALKARIRELDAELEAKAIEHIQEHGPITAGDIKWYVGTKKTTRCTQPKDTAEAISRAVDGDWDAFLACLTAQPFKHGACRAVLPAGDFERCFETTEAPDLKTGKPAKELCRVDTRFVTQR